MARTAAAGLVAAAVLAMFSPATGMSCYVMDAGAPMLMEQAQLGSESPGLRSPVQNVLQEMAEVKIRAASEIAESGVSPVSVPVHFVLHNVADIEDVIVVGSWTHWVEHFKLLKKATHFEGWVAVPVGTHHFKFITDGAPMRAFPRTCIRVRTLV